MADTTTRDDFYLDERGLASYFECAWLSKFRELGNAGPLASASAKVPEDYINSTFFTQVADFVFDSTGEFLNAPQSMLEIGPALGRTCHHTLRRFPSISNVTVVEPSQRLLDGFRRILVEGQVTSFPYIQSARELQSISVDTRRTAEECQHVDFTLLNTTMQSDTISRQFDIVYCLNVIDQASLPNEVVLAAMECTKVNGVLVLSCSYQWQKKRMENIADAVSDINEYFDASWEKISEKNLDYKFRYNERFTHLFCSHVVAYKKQH